MKIGSKEHKQRFCGDFIAGHEPYDPIALAWPDLDAKAVARLRAIPFWSEVLHTEQRAGAIVDAFGAMIDDPLVRRAVDLQGFEEARHGQMFCHMLERYGIAAAETPVEIGSDPYRAFADFGYGECIDAFLGFGVFKIAQRAAFLPEPMFAIFDKLMHEENRHVVFFVNWMAWEQARRGRGAAGLRAVVAGYYYLRAIGRLLATVRRGRAANGGRDFAATEAGVFIDGFSLFELIEECCAENDRRMQAFDRELLRPELLPRLAKAALPILRPARRSARSR